jgi:hypothetical protein
MFEKLSKSVTVTDLEGAAAGCSARLICVRLLGDTDCPGGGGIQEIRKCSGAERGGRKKLANMMRTFCEEIFPRCRPLYPSRNWR